MSIDEVMERTIEYGLMMRTATISESRALNTSIRAAVEQHVADAVKAELEAIASIGDERAKALLSIIGLAVVPSAVIQRDRAEQWRLYAAAIRARADHVVDRGDSPVCKHGVRTPHECKDCEVETDDAVIALQRIHDYADTARTKGDDHCFALHEIVALCRAALCAIEAKEVTR